MVHNLSDIEFSRVCEVIASNMGLNFPIDRKAMVSRNLSEAARELGFHKMREFIPWFLTTPLKSEHIEIIASYLTISETYFWREPHVFTALSQNAISELVDSKKNRDKSIKIWCAGCSTGEEAYSIAIALCRTIPKIKDWNITIMATDINAIALNKARVGIYGSWSFRNSPSWLKGFYFKRNNNREYEIIPEIKEMVTFSSFNLASENYLSSVCGNSKMDVIFCRNVLMYFTKEWAARVSENLFHSLSEKGWLIVSSCELSSELFPQYTPVNFTGAVLYRKSGKESVSSLTVNSDQEKPLQLLSDKALFGHQDAVKEVAESDLQPASTFLNSFQTHQSIVNTPEVSLNEYKISIRTLADRGQLEEALSVCNEAIAKNKFVPALYYLRASIFQEMDKSNEAIKSLKQAIYIDPDYIMGHFALGNIFFRQGIIKNAKLYFNNALELLSKLSGDVIPTESEGLSAKYIRRIIHDSMQIQKSV